MTLIFKVPNSAIMTAGMEVDVEGKWFMKSVSEDVASSRVSQRKCNDHFTF